MKQVYVVPINDDEFSLSWSPSTLNLGCMYFVTDIPTDVTGQWTLRKIEKVGEVGEQRHAGGGGGGIGGYPIPQNRKKNWQIPKYCVKNRRNTDTAFIFGHAYLKGVSISLETKRNVRRPRIESVQRSKRMPYQFHHRLSVRNCVIIYH